MPCELHLHHSNPPILDSLHSYLLYHSLLKKITKTMYFRLKLFKKQRETSQPLVAIKPKP
jgi:hypothetical protein